MNFLSSVFIELNDRLEECVREIGIMIPPSALKNTEYFVAAEIQRDNAKKRGDHLGCR